MQRRFTVGDLIPIDLEINATCRRRNSERIIKFLQDLEAATTPKEEPRSSKASSSFPIARHCHIESVEDTIMAEEPRRVKKKKKKVVKFVLKFPVVKFVKNKEEKEEENKEEGRKRKRKKKRNKRKRKKS